MSSSTAQSSQPWQERTDPTSQRKYYVNTTTAEKTWTAPKGFRRITAQPSQPWQERTDPASQRKYYVNTTTAERTWTAPEGFHRITAQPSQQSMSARSQPYSSQEQPPSRSRAMASATDNPIATSNWAAPAAEADPDVEPGAADAEPSTAAEDTVLRRRRLVRLNSDVEAAAATLRETKLWQTEFDLETVEAIEHFVIALTGGGARGPA